MEKTDFKCIAFIGFRGTGKSTISRLLAEKLEWKYISTDQQIEEKAGITINEIVGKKGWKYFRKLETEIIDGLVSSRNMVIDTGGGIVENQKNILQLNSYSLMVWVDANIKDIIERIQRQGNRPLLNKVDLVEDTKFNYGKRVKLYRQYSDLQFNTSIEKPDDICKKIILEMSKAE